MSTRDALKTYLLTTAAATSEWQPPLAPAEAAEHQHALELLADVIGQLAEDDDRLQTLASLAIRDGRFTPGAATEHAIKACSASSREACLLFLNNLVRIARDDALARARSHGFLPTKRP
jgi:hypothetical protein